MKIKVLAFLLLFSCLGSAADQSPAAFQPANGSFFAISVPNVELSSRWYQEKLGFKVVKRSQSPDGLSRAIIVRLQDAVVEIVQHHDSTAPLKLLPGMKGPHLIQGVFKVGFFVNDAEDLYARLKKQKFEFIGGLFEDKEMRLKSFLIKDNNGNILQFFTPLSGKTKPN